MSEWGTYKIGDICEVIGGGTPSTKDDTNFGGNIAWITPRDLTNHQSRYIRYGERNITEKGLKSSSARILPKGTILLSSRAPVGYLAIAEDELCTNQGFRSLIVKEGFHNEFIYYLLLANVEYLKSQATGTTFLELSGSVLKSLEFSIPPLPEQRAIAQMLGSLDDKIEANRRENETLEATARAIFKSWFVDFDPIHAKLRGEIPAGMDEETARLFPDAFVESELGLIPQGWEVGMLGDVAENPRRSVQPEEVPANTSYVGLEHIPRQNLALQDWGAVEDINSNKYQFEEGEILFGKLRPYFHKVVFAPIQGICSTDILVIAPKDEIFYCLSLVYLSSESVIDYATRVSTGTRMPRTNWDNLSQYQIILPAHEILKIFNEILFPMLEQIRNNVFEARVLAETRDALLPKLMSGEVRVGDLL